VSISVNIHLNSVVSATAATHEGRDSHSWVTIATKGGDVVLHIPQEAGHEGYSRRLAALITEMTTKKQAEAA
jgi:ribosomal silencing factor RsfS